MKTRGRLLLTALVGVVLGVAGGNGVGERPASSAPTAMSSTVASQRYLVQADGAASAAEAVRRVGGQVVADLPIIAAVGAELSDAQYAALAAEKQLRLFRDSRLELSGRWRDTHKAHPSKSAEAHTTDLLAEDETAQEPTEEEFARSSESDGVLQVEEISRSMLDKTDYHHPSLLGVPELHEAGINGEGVTVAVVDTGLWWEADTLLSKSPAFRVGSLGLAADDDPNGHGTHVSSIIASNNVAANWVREGIAPRARIGVVRSFAYDGSSTYIDTIAALDYVVKNRKKLNVRVLNLSFSARPQSYYWDDPLNQAVMTAWKAGIVVVAAAGNDGPNPMTVGVPGNVPYIITVGAMSDNYTPADGTDDVLASFSSSGPTHAGFVKPEVVAPGGHIQGSMPYDAWIPSQHPDSMSGSERQFEMSGTSQATAIVSGIVALMLQNDPELTPDEVKCKLMASAKAAVDPDGALAYSVFQQGAGMVDAVAAVNSTASDCANQGLDIDQDLKGTAHYGGPANVDEEGNYYLEDADGNRLKDEDLQWNGSYAWDGGYLWSDGRLWSRSDLWASGRLWSRGRMWSRSVSWDEGQMFSSGLTEVMSINRWVDHE